MVTIIGVRIPFRIGDNYRSSRRKPTTLVVRELRSFYLGAIVLMLGAIVNTVSADPNDIGGVSRRDRRR